MTTREVTVTGWSSWLNSAIWPFLWILLVPMLTVPLTIALLDGVTSGGSCVEIPSNNIDRVWECPREDVLPTLLPGLLNLVPFLWVFSSLRQVRNGAVVAGGLGAVRLLLPALIYAVEGADVTVLGSWQLPPAMAGNASLIASPILWLLTPLAAMIFARSSTGRIIWIVLAAFAALVTLNLAGQGAFLLSRLP